jgi:formamidopyrimidine-DNA glycosylase
MPELPEVQTIVDQLRPKLVGRTIRVKVLDAKAVNLKAAVFENRVSGTRVLEVERRAKLIWWRLAGDKNLLFHLKLTGRILFLPDKGPEHKETRVVFDIEGPNRVFFDDFRRFGWIKYFIDEELKKYWAQENYGPEPLGKDFTLEKFRLLLADKPRAKIKPLLMDQTFIAGVGNIYSQEACFYAGILPTRQVKTLKDEEIKKLYQGLIHVLDQAIKYHGSSSDAYLDIYGKEGGFVPHLQVYGREGEKCKRCGGTIKVMKLGGRGTRWCGKCQK